MTSLDAAAELRPCCYPEHSVEVRRVREKDLPAVIALDGRVTKLPKAEYWQDLYRRYGRRRLQERFFLVASSAAAPDLVLGFIVGEVRAWEFGSDPCGWVFALSVDPDSRLSGVGSALLAAISAEFKRVGVGKLRTMVARDARLSMLFFRGAGMVAGPYLQLEKEIA
jgi:ribosomal protein S18 acetylase RimI-like enzyme